jgi:hypothetical protein
MAPEPSTQDAPQPGLTYSELIDSGLTGDFDETTWHIPARRSLLIRRAKIEFSMRCGLVTGGGKHK